MTSMVKFYDVMKLMKGKATVSIACMGKQQHRFY